MTYRQKLQKEAARKFVGGLAQAPTSRLDDGFCFFGGMI